MRSVRKLFGPYAHITNFTLFVGVSLVPAYFYTRSSDVPQDEQALESALVRVCGVLW